MMSLGMRIEDSVFAKLLQSSKRSEFAVIVCVKSTFQLYFEFHCNFIYNLYHEKTMLYRKIFLSVHAHPAKSSRRAIESL